MTTPSLTQPLPPFRRVRTLVGDTLQAVAARELADGARWWELLYLNQLTYPYLTDDPAQVVSGVLLTGGEIMVPSATAAAAQSDPALIYGSDTALGDDGLLGVADGDLAVVTGPDNMRQALLNRINTERGELEYHVAYGCSARGLLGRRGTPNSLLAAALVKRSLAQDDRLRSVDSAQATLAGDVLAITATVTTVASAVMRV